MTSTLPPLTQAFAGGIGAVVANAGTFPLDVVGTRLQTQKSERDLGGRRKASAAEVVLDIVGEDGYSGLYAGFLSDSLATLITNFVYFYVYSYTRTKIIARKADRAELLKSLREPSPYPYPPPRRSPTVMLSTIEELGAGFLAAAIGRIVSTPLSVITVKQQVARDKADGIHRPGFVSTLRRIYREDGILGFWKGIQSTVLLCSHPAITLLLYQVYRVVFLRGKEGAVPSPKQAFIGAAGSNAIVITLLYPLILLKTRIQSAPRQGKGVTELFTTFHQVVDDHGPSGLYDGLAVQLVKGILNLGITMMTKQRIETLIVAAYHWSRQKQVSA